MQVELTKMSSKGQVVIPSGMRKGIPAGEKLLVLRNKDQIILKRATDLDKQLKEDLEFARRTEEAYKRYEKGEFRSMGFDEFIAEMKKW